MVYLGQVVIYVYSLMSLTAITIGGEHEELPYFSWTYHICHPVSSWNCSSFVALCSFLVEG